MVLCGTLCSISSMLVVLQVAHVETGLKTPPTTKFVPFQLSSDNRSHINSMTTEEIRLAELKARKAEEARHRRRVLQRQRTMPAVLPHSASPKITKPKPFNLAGVVLHEQEMHNRHLAIKARPSFLCLLLHCSAVSHACHLMLCGMHPLSGMGKALFCSGSQVMLCVKSATRVCEEGGGAAASREAVSSTPLRPLPLQGRGHTVLPYIREQSHKAGNTKWAALCCRNSR
jgi:hypothetical protein